MSGWNDAWLREHQTRMASFQSQPVSSVVTANYIAFTLPKPSLLLNTLLRMSWPERHRYAKALSAEIAALVPHDLGRVPFQRAQVLIRRFSIRECDQDNADGGAKIMRDCLLVRSSVHPNGLGFIVDDGPRHLISRVECEIVSGRANQRTLVSIERLP